MPLFFFSILPFKIGQVIQKWGSKNNLKAYIYIYIWQESNLFSLWFCGGDKVMNRDSLIFHGNLAGYHGSLSWVQMPPASLLSGHLSYTHCIDGFYRHQVVPCFILKSQLAPKQFFFFIYIKNCRFL